MTFTVNNDFGMHFYHSLTQSSICDSKISIFDSYSSSSSYDLEKWKERKDIMIKIHTYT